jgi:hypothetical protein
MSSFFKSTPYLSTASEKEKIVYLTPDIIQLISTTYAHDEHRIPSSRPGSTDNLHHPSSSGVTKLSTTLAAVVSGLDDGKDFEGIFESTPELEKLAKAAMAGGKKKRGKGKRESLSVAFLSPNVGGGGNAVNSESDGDLEGGYESSKDDIGGVAPSVKALWSGNLSALGRMRKSRSAAASPLPSPNRMRRGGGKDVDKMSPWSDDNEGDTADGDSVSSGHGPVPGPVRFGAKLGDWTG